MAQKVSVRDFKQFLQPRLQTFFASQGRSLLALLDGMEAWHRLLSWEKALKGTVYKSSGFRAGRWEFGSEWNRSIWTMEELLTSKDLQQEGRRMNHCVANYANSVQGGQTSIWSLQCNNVLCLTVEVANWSRTIVQARGRSNRPATEIEKMMLHRWATENRLTVRGYV
jgi:hypothetical protein